jgi:hypothetical protein
MAVSSLLIPSLPQDYFTIKRIKIPKHYYGDEIKKSGTLGK